MATSPGLIASLKDSTNSNFISSGNPSTNPESMDVISFSPKEMKETDLYHPILLNEPVDISENVQESLNSLKTVLIFSANNNPKRENVEILLDKSSGKKVSSSKKGSPQMMEPMKILASSVDDDKHRSMSPEVASEMDSFIDYMEAPESSRVVEEYSESHHKHHH